MHHLRKSLFLRWLAYIFLALNVTTTAHGQEVASYVNDALIRAISADNLNPDRRLLMSLYQQHDDELLWFAEKTATTQAFEILKVLNNAASYGLKPEDYNAQILMNRLSLLADAVQRGEDIVDTRVALDLDISMAVLRFIRHLHCGRINPRDAGFNLNSNHADQFDELSIVTALTTSNDLSHVVATIEPQFLHYQLLKMALTRYRQLMTNPDLTNLPAFTARSIKPGETYEGASALRRLLIVEQDMTAEQSIDDDDNLLDPSLVQGLMNYQRRHGLPIDGSLGKQTFIALTTPFEVRAQQIELTLERWRWLPSIASPMIVVNIPQFRLFAFNTIDDREANLLRMDVIVGQTFVHTQTPVFLADLKYVVFRPYWDVPADIVKREILGEINRHPDYLQRNQFELVDGNGDNSPVVPATSENIARLAAGSLRLRQRPGVNNALGEVKFMLPNNYNVYLHSTPAKKLFAAPRRAFSHGCIRVSDPAALAEYVLRYAADEWDRARIEDAMQGSENQRVYLKTPIPVMIVYGTAIANEAGQVLFYDDIYGNDKRLSRLLQKSY